MAVHSIYGGATYPGTVSVGTDGTPNIRLGQSFYTYGAGMPGSQVVGGRVWIPAGPRPSASVRIMCWSNQAGSKRTQFNIDTTPDRSVTVSIPNDGLARWVEATWAGIDTPPLGYVFIIGYEFVESTATYLFYPDARATSAFVVASDGSKFCWAEHTQNAAPTGPFDGYIYRIGTNTPASGFVDTAGYGIDALVNDSAGGNAPPIANAGFDQSVSVGSVVTLNGSASTDTDGTITTYAWAQLTGTAVTLSGSGSNRTFTPSATGTYTFRLTVTDDDGATGTDDVSVTVSATGANTIAQENALTGTGRQFWYDGVGVTAMPAFGRSTYYAPGAMAEFSVNYNAGYTYEVYRLGHYGGTGGRRILTATAGTPAAQPTPVAIPNSNGAVQCSAWSKNVMWQVPANATPGWYYLFLKGTNGSDFGHVLFCVTDTAAKKPVLMVSSDATWHAAYNGFGGNNVYGASTGIGDANNRALCSTYDKPVITKDNVPQTHFFNSQFAAFKYTESLGIEVGYATIEQLDADPTVLDGRQVIVFAGHNEYVSQPIVNKVKSLLASGQKIINWAANDFFWRIRFGTTDSTATTTKGRVMWCKKDTLPGPTGVRSGSAGVPFTTAADWQGTWQDTRWALREPSADYLGDRFIANGLRYDAVKVPAAMKSFPLWRNCAGIQSLGGGAEFSFGASSLGMEWDMPDGSLEMVKVSSSVVNLANSASDVDGQIYSNSGTYEHAITLVQSGTGLVFNFNSDQWGATLDNFHDSRFGAIATVEARQACLNMLVDFGVTANAGMVSTAGLTMPSPVADVAEAYGLEIEEPPPSIGSMFYSDGTSWTQLG